MGGEPLPRQSPLLRRPDEEERMPAAGVGVVLLAARIGAAQLAQPRHQRRMLGRDVEGLAHADSLCSILKRGNSGHRLEVGMGKATGSLGSLLAACVWLSYGLISPATCAAAPSPAQERPRLPLEGATSNPGWVKQPTAEEMANYYPRPAQLLGLEGKAVLEC